MSPPRVLLLANHDHPEVVDVLHELRELIARHADIVAEFDVDQPKTPSLEPDQSRTIRGLEKIRAQLDLTNESINTVLNKVRRSIEYKERKA